MLHTGRRWRHMYITYLLPVFPYVVPCAVVQCCRCLLSVRRHAWTVAVSSVLCYTISVVCALFCGVLVPFSSVLWHTNAVLYQCCGAFVLSTLEHHFSVFWPLLCYAGAVILCTVPVPFLYCGIRHGTILILFSLSSVLENSSAGVVCIVE
jgi:hypothetical protein